jgi:hypothetical protein
MARNDDLLNMVLSSARYSFSNLTALLIGGIVIALSFLVIGLPFFLGYITRCMKEIVKGNGVMPEWDDIGLMFVDGIRMTFVFFVYAGIYVIVILVPLVPLVIFNMANIPILAVMSTGVLAVTAAVVACVLAISFFGSWIIYANTGSVRKAITVRKIFEFVSSDPQRYIETIIASAAVVMVGAVAMTLVVTIPWAIFVICATMTFIYAKFYQDTMKSTPHALDWK